MRALPVLAFVACMACLPACSRKGAERPTRLRHNVHDLIALASRADVDDIDKHLPHPDPTLDDRDHRDGVSLLRCPAGQSITFPPLTVTGVATLRVGCGTWAPPGAVSDDRVVRFLVEAARVDGAAPDAERHFAPVAERQHKLPEIEAHGTFDIDVELPPASAGGQPGGALGAPPAPDQDATWVLRFSTQRWITGDGPPRIGRPEEITELNWPAWTAPTLRSAGRRVPLGEDPLYVPATARNLVATLDRARVIEQDPAHPVVVGSIDPSDDGVVVGGRRDAIVATGLTRIRYQITPEPDDVLEWSLTVDNLRGTLVGGDGMRFAIEIDGERFFELAVNAPTIRSDRRWQSFSEDLSRFAGKQVALDLVTEPGDAHDAVGDVGGWASTRLIRKRAVPRLAVDAGPSIVVIVIDTLRADRLGSSGRTPTLSPRLDALAARGTVFRAARSTASWTWPATASILTGLSPDQHGVHDARYCLLADEIDTLAELGQLRGYTTGAFAANLLISRDNRFHQGFETFSLTAGVTARALNEHAVTWLEQTDGLARLLYLHYIDPHAPYAPPAGYLTAPGVPPEAAVDDADALDAELQTHLAPVGNGEVPPELVARYLKAASARYDAEVAYVDTAIGELLDALAAHGALDDAIVVVTADHGEEFYEHGGYGHGPSLYEETVRVPLIITTFGARFATTPGQGGRPPAVVTAPVTTRDIVPTLIALASLPAPSRPLSGGTLMPVGKQSLPAGPFYSETLLGKEPPNPKAVEKLSICDGRWKLVSTAAVSRVELYDLQTDPLEKHDLSKELPARRDAMLAALNEGYPGIGAAASGDAAPDADSEAAIERMRALGYVGKDPRKPQR